VGERLTQVGEEIAGAGEPVDHAGEDINHRGEVITHLPMRLKPPSGMGRFQEASAKKKG